MPSPRVPTIPRLACALALSVLAGCSTTWVSSQYRQPDRFATWVDAAPGQYRIQPGDDIAVILPFNTELNQTGLVAPDGTFTMPLAGVLPAAGLSPPQFAASIDHALAANGVVANARTSVRVNKYAGEVYVDGQVGLPGAVPLRADMTVQQAITAARGVKDTARTDEVVLIRRGPDGRPMLRTVNIDALTHQGDPNQAVVLQASDTVFVPKSSIAEVDQWVDQHLNQTLPFSKSVNYSYNVNPSNYP